MNTTHDTWFDRLGSALRASGMPEDEVTATVSDLTAYADDAEGTDPVEEFGSPEEFAARLTGGAPVDGPAARAETWKWTCDLYNDRRLLDQYGDEGWEVERIDRAGRFVCRRDPAAALRWEYRREMAENAKERAARTAGLAPEGWEPAGHWMYLMYFKRPKAASAGPAGGLDAVPQAPAERVLLGLRVRRLLLVSALMVMVCAVFLVTGITDLSEPSTVAALLIALPVGALAGWYGSKRDARKGVTE